MKQLLHILMLATTTVGLNHSPVAAQEQVVTLDQSQLFVSQNEQVQHFTQSINLVKGQDKLQLTLTYYNGTSTMPGFKWLRISSSSMSYLTEAQFGGKKTLSVDVTGDLSWGGNQLIIEAGGPKGAAFGWRLTTPHPTLLSVHPTTGEPGGTVTISGTNLCTDASGDVITVGGMPAQCLSGNGKSMVVKLPEGLKSGTTQAVVKIGGIDAGTIPLSIDASPVLTGLSNTYVPPGSPLTIYGENLSPTPSMMKVTIGPFPCDVISATTNSITVTAPLGFTGSPWGINQPVKVWVNGALSNSRLTVSVYNTIGNN
jgi:hypothetical protein